MAKKLTVEELEKEAAAKEPAAKATPAKAKSKSKPKQAKKAKAKPAKTSAKKAAKPKPAKVQVRAKKYTKINYKVAKAPAAGYKCACGCGKSVAKVFARGHVSVLLKLGRASAHKAIDRAYDRIEKR